MTDVNAPAPVPRRRFLEMTAACVGACAGVGALGVAGVVVIGTPLSGPAGEAGAWVDVGPLARFPDGGAMKLAIEGERTDAWQRFPRRTLGSAVLVRRGEQVRVWSATCPHNGCDVIVDAKDFLCPCHDSRFALDDGRALGGPSPRGLDPLEAEVKDGRVRVRWARFEIGIAERKPL
jgi:nitrite reductase/ring-hydroxylating ferredoxin subunit